MVNKTESDLILDKADSIIEKSMGAISLLRESLLAHASRSTGIKSAIFVGSALTALEAAIYSLQLASDSVKLWRDGTLIKETISPTEEKKKPTKFGSN